MTEEVYYHKTDQPIETFDTPILIQGISTHSKADIFKLLRLLFSCTNTLVNPQTKSSSFPKYVKFVFKIGGTNEQLLMKSVAVDGKDFITNDAITNSHNARTYDNSIPCIAYNVKTSISTFAIYDATTNELHFPADDIVIGVDVNKSVDVKNVEVKRDFKFVSHKDWTLIIPTYVQPTRCHFADLVLYMEEYVFYLTRMCSISDDCVYVITQHMREGGCYGRSTLLNYVYNHFHSDFLFTFSDDDDVPMPLSTFTNEDVELQHPTNIVNEAMALYLNEHINFKPMDITVDYKVPITTLSKSTSLFLCRHLPENQYASSWGAACPAFILYPREAFNHSAITFDGGPMIKEDYRFHHMHDYVPFPIIKYMKGTSGNQFYSHVNVDVKYTSYYFKLLRQTDRYLRTGIRDETILEQLPEPYSGELCLKPDSVMKMTVLYKNNTYDYECHAMNTIWQKHGNDA